MWGRFFLAVTQRADAGAAARISVIDHSSASAASRSGKNARRPGMGLT